MMRFLKHLPPRTKYAAVILTLFGVLAVGALVHVVTRHASRVTHEQATYYCPMHPQMTSNRPGACPICSMKLVKREETPVSAAPQQPATRPMKDICYLHNCPMMKPGQQCPMLVVAKAGENVTCPVCGTHVTEAAASPSSAPRQKNILYWTDPMIPGFKAEKPGKSPMGMDLVPVYEEAGAPAVAPTTPSGYAPILVTPQKQQLIGVTIALVERRAMTKTIRAAGIIAHDPELYQAQQEYIEARAAFAQAQASQFPEVIERAERLVESSQLRLRHLGLSEEMIQDIATWTKPDHRLLLGGAGQLWVYASIYEYELPSVKPGQTVTVDVSALPHRTFRGTVKAIDPMLEHMTRTARVRILVEDPEGALKPAMYVNVSLAVEVGDVLAVPEGAVFQTGTQSIVFVDKGQGLFEPRDVTIGAKADDLYEVQAGLTEGERVVTSGNFLIDSESRLKAALQGMSHGH